MSTSGLKTFRDLHPRAFFLDAWRAIDAEAREERAADPNGERYDFDALIALLTGAVFLTLMEYFGGSRTFVKLVDKLAEGGGIDSFWLGLQTSQFARLYEFAWWSGWRVLGYLVLPVLVIKLFMRRKSVREYGLESGGFREHGWVYVLMYLVVLACVVVVSFFGEFNQYYPFYRLASRSWLDFVAWELLYAAQFLSLEFFFRGFWLRACKGAMGSQAIWVMVVPYCMIHFGKPLLETFGAIAAGIVLGTLAMRTRSIWSGFLIHVSVAVSMDVAALLQTTGLPKVLTPP